MSKKFYVYIKEGENDWEECGEGPLGQKTAERIAREIREDCCPAKVVNERDHAARIKPWDLVVKKWGL